MEGKEPERTEPDRQFAARQASPEESGAKPPLWAAGDSTPVGSNLVPAFLLPSPGFIEGQAGYGALELEYRVPEDCVPSHRRTERAVKFGKGWKLAAS